MFSKIDIARIIRDHVATFQDDATGRRMKSDYFLFFGLPLVLALFLLFILRLSLDQGAVGILVTSLSIFAALLFNLLLLIYDVVRKVGSGTGELKQRFLSQIYSNISFAILISLLSIIVLLGAYFGLNGSCFALATSFAVYYLVSLFVLTLFMILKRVHVLLSREFDDT
jgi:hypothetical protein